MLIDEPGYVLDKIKSFNKLPKGWHYGLGGPCSQKVIDKATDLYNFSQIYDTEINVFPGLDGEIAVNFYWPTENKSLNNAIEIVVNVDLSLDFVYEVGINTEYKEISSKKNVSYGFIISEFSKLRGKDG